MLGCSPPCSASSSAAHPLRSVPVMLVLRVLLFAVGFALALHDFGPEPKFTEPIQNVTIPVDRDASLSCIVEHLGSFRVAWIKVDTQTILTIHTHVITHNSRVSTTHNGQRQWNLHIRNIKEDDRGYYMCQINSSPMKSQTGYVEVVVPPDILWDETSSDVSVTEGHSVSLDCRATGYPKPNITWRREDGEPIVLRVGPREKIKVQSIETDSLNISRVHRRHMGAYLCIASNGVPPAVSKRVKLQVNFEPLVKVPNQLVGAPMGKEVVLECQIEASPRSVNYWTRDSGEVLISSPKYNVTETENSYKVLMKLTIKDLETKDFGVYNCVSKNSLGEAEGSIRLHELDLPAPSIQLDFEDRIEGHVLLNDSYSVQRSTDSQSNNLPSSNLDQPYQGRKYGLPKGSSTRGSLHDSRSHRGPSGSSTDDASSAPSVTVGWGPRWSCWWASVLVYVIRR